MGNDPTPNCNLGFGRDLWYSFTTDATGGYYVFDCTRPNVFTAASALSLFDSCGGARLACDLFRGHIGITLAANLTVKIRVVSSLSQQSGQVSLSVTKTVPGACCPHNDFPCSITDSMGCFDGVYIGNGTTCQPDQCPPVGGCCTGECCSRTRESGCPGLWFSGSTCTPQPCGAAPVNDTCEGALPVTLGMPALGSNCTATNDSAASCRLANRDVWHTFTAAIAGVYQFDTNGTFRATVLALFDACGGAEVACDFGSGQFGDSLLVFPLEAGASVKIRLASIGLSPIGGDYRLNVSRLPSGACCEDSGSCSLTRSTSCTGVFRGDQTSCEPNPCLGACCSGAACQMTAPAACAGTNQVYVGWFTSCTPYSATAPCCRADFNRSGAAPTVQDIFDFLAGYFVGDPQADTNDSGGNSVQDIFDFLAAYFAGCS